MKKIKQMGIWMDHSSALLMELADDAIIRSNVLSDFTHEDKEFSLTKSEKVMHNKEHQQRNSYYKKLGDVIKNFNDVVLFGPTNAKDELLNILKGDHHFEHIKIIVKHSDKMQESQMHTFVKEYFK